MQKKTYIAPMVEVFGVEVECKAPLPLSRTLIKNMALDDPRLPGSIELVNDGPGSVTPSKANSLWDDDEDEDW